jgi:hypothetical protein
MTSPSGQNQQNNQANNGPLFANQNGNQFNTVNITNQLKLKQARARTGWAILVLLVLDVAFFFYGQAAYTGQADSSGDLWRAGIAVVLFAITISLIRRWFRTRL